MTTYQVSPPEQFNFSNWPKWHGLPPRVNSSSTQTKRDRRNCICVDLSRLNESVCQESHHLPALEQILLSIFYLGCQLRILADPSFTIVHYNGYLLFLHYQIQCTQQIHDGCIQKYIHNSQMLVICHCRGRPSLSNTSFPQHQWDSSPNRRNHAQKTVNKFIFHMGNTVLNVCYLVFPQCLSAFKTNVYNSQWPYRSCLPHGLKNVI